MQKAVVFLFWSIVAMNGQAQESIDSLRRWSFNIAPNFGFIVPHTSQITHLIQGHSYGLYIGVSRPVTGKAQWHHVYNYPEQGFDLSLINTGNPEQLGQQYAASFLLNLTLNRKSKSTILSQDQPKFRHWLGLGIGLGYATRYWDLETNHQAAALGSAVNIALTLQYSCRIVQFQNAQIRAGLRISHLSNGAFQLPNLGTNNAGVFLSFINHKNASHPNLHGSLSEYTKNHVSLSGLFGLKEIPPPTGRKYISLVLSTLGERRVSYKSSFGLGLDVFCNTSLKPLMERKSIEMISYSDVLQLGAIFSYTLHFNDFELKMQQGLYIRDNWKIDGKLYHRFGLRYYLSEQLFTQLTLKTHFAKADFGELGLGIRW